MVIFESKTNKTTVIVNEEATKLIELTEGGLLVILDDGERRKYSGIIYSETEEESDSKDVVFTGKETVN